MIRRIRIWWHARWFRKHWDFTPEAARRFAEIRVKALENGAGKDAI